MTVSSKKASRKQGGDGSASPPRTSSPKNKAKVGSTPHRQRVLSDPESVLSINVDFDAIPEALRKKQHWILWKPDWNEARKKWDKVPYRTDGKKKAAVNRPECRTTFEQACKAAEEHGLGVGFVFTGDDIVGVDLDDCRNPNSGRIAAWARAIIKKLKTYTEISPSGTGVKVFLNGTMPPDCGHNYRREESGGFEVYSDKKYFTVTGQHLEGTPKELKRRTNALAEVMETVKGWKAKQLQKRTTVSNSFSKSNLTESEVALAALKVLDSDMDYECWLKVGMALHAVDPSSEMCSHWAGWSEKSDKYVEGEPEEKWQTFDSEGGVGLATLCRMADDTGENWRPRISIENDSACRQKVRNSRIKSTSIDIDTFKQMEFKPFPVELLPKTIERFVEAAAKSIGCDKSAIAIPALVASAAAIGNSRIVRIKNDWSEPSILWAAIVARSGDRKSPAIASALQPLRTRQSESLREFESIHREWQRKELVQYESALATWKKSKPSSRGLPPQRPDEPKPWRILCDDVTIEALGALLQQNPRGLLLGCDELSNWLMSFQRYKSGSGSDSPKWLEMHAARMLLIDRKGGDRKTVHIPRAAVSLVGTIQPEILENQLTAEHRASGLAARLLLAMPPSEPRRWTDHEISSSIKNNYVGIFKNLLSLKMRLDESDGALVPQSVGMTTKARKRFAKFVNEHGAEQIELSAELAATWSKIEAYAARLSLIHHLVRCAEGDETLHNRGKVDSISMNAGIAIARWFAREAERIETHFDQSDEQREQRELVKWIQHRGGTVTPTALQKGNRHYRESSQVAESALRALVAAKLGSISVVKTKGRPRTQFSLTAQLRVDVDKSEKAA